MITGRSGCSRFRASRTWMPSSLEPCSQISRMTRAGRRALTAAKAPSLSPAMRVSYPSSRRMPEIKSRISSSSSTTRISDAISDPFLLIFNTFLTHSLLYHRECERDDGTRRSGRVVEQDFSAMVFHDLADDGEAEARALGAGRDIGFGEVVAMLGRQADAVVGDAESQHRAAAGIVGMFQRHFDPPRRAVALGLARRDALARVFQHIGQGLGDQPPVALEMHRLLGRVGREHDIGIGDALQE